MTGVKRSLVVGLTLSILLLVTGITCLTNEEDARYGGVIQVALGISPPYLDWHQTTAGATEAPASHIFETLVTFNDEFEFIPQLARDWTVSDDYLTWTFSLRKGVLFHNGKELTGEDVKASIERFRRVAERGSDFDVVESIEVPEPYKVVFHLSEPTQLLSALSTTVNGAGIYPKEIIQEYGDDVIPAEGIIGTGPYKLKEWTEEQVVLERFDDYVPNKAFPATGYGGWRKAYLDQIVFNYVPEASSRIAGLETGEYHLATELPLSEIDRLKENPDLVVRAFSPYYKPIYFTNCTKWPTSDQRIRQALRMAANMEEVLAFTTYGNEQFYNANGSVFFDDQKKWFTTKGLEDYNPMAKNPKATKKKVKQLMKEAGYDGAEIVLTTTRDYPWIYRESVGLYDQWTKMGFNVKLAVYPWASFVNHIQVDTNTNVWATGLGFPTDPSANAYVYDAASGHNKSLVMGTAKNNPVIAKKGYISDAARKIHELIQEDNKTFDFEKRFELWKEIQSLLLEDPYAVIIGDYKSLQAHSSTVHGYKALKRETFWNVWLED